MNITGAIGTILGELVNGAGDQSGWVLNPKDPGLLTSLERISAEDASRVPPHGTASIASHVDHVRYGLSLLNRTTHGENPFAGADWTAAWRTIRVTDAEWDRLRRELRTEAEKWAENFAQVAGAGEMELTGVIASAAHLAYHLGAIRQMSAAARGPKEGAA